jgi:murein DD-endopeptidase MepM/ murein hydrolase activator NlpD
VTGRRFPGHRFAARIMVCVLALQAQPARADGLPKPLAAQPIADPAATITVSKASDGLGAPIALRPKPSVPVAGAVGMEDRPRGLPVAARALTSRFGMRSHPILGVYRMHSGVDLAAPNGSPVSSPAAGIVSFANWSGGYGLLVTVDHGNGLQTRFAHLSRLMVNAGQKVIRGQLLGLVGSSGRSTGSHLHYEMRQNGRAVDPLAVR